MSYFSRKSFLKGNAKLKKIDYYKVILKNPIFLMKLLKFTFFLRVHTLASNEFVVTFLRVLIFYLLL